MILSADTGVGLIVADTIAQTYTVTLDGVTSAPAPIPAAWADWIAGLTNTANAENVRRLIRDGIQDLIALQSQAAALIAASDTLRDGTTLAPATYSKAAMDAVIVAVRGLAARQSAILRVLSGEFADDLIGLARLAAQQVRED